MTLIDGIDLAHRVDNVRRAEACPICRAPMIVDLSRYGWWLHCVVPGCKGKRDLGNEPGRAVELLTRAA